MKTLATHPALVRDYLLALAGLTRPQPQPHATPALRRPPPPRAATPGRTAR